MLTVQPAVSMILMTLASVTALMPVSEMLTVQPAISMIPITLTSVTALMPISEMLTVQPAVSMMLMTLTSVTVLMTVLMLIFFHRITDARLFIFLQGPTGMSYRDRWKISPTHAVSYRERLRIGQHILRMEMDKTFH